MSDKETDDDKNQRKVVINSRRPGNVVINGRTAVHAGSGGVLTTSDVCKTPSKCRPRNYTNVAVSEDAAKTASSVFINGNPACHSQSIFSKSTGDEPGTCGGVKSGTIKQKAEFVTYSNNVFIEGFPAVRQFDLMVSNNRNTPPAPLMQPGAGTPPNLSPENAEGVPLKPESHAVDLDTAGEELSLLKGQYSVLDPNQPSPNAPTPSASQDSAAGWDQIVGGIKVLLNEFGKRTAGILADEMGLHPTDVETGREVDLATDGHNPLTADNAAEAKGMQTVQNHAATAAAVGTLMALTSRFRSVVRHPDQFVADMKKALPHSRSPSEALGKVGLEQAKRRLGHQTDSRYIDRYHGPDDMTRKDNTLAEWEAKGNKTDSTTVAKDKAKNKQGSKAKNKKRAEKMVTEKAKKVGLPSNRQGGPYTHEEIALWEDVYENDGEKQHLSVHTNTQTGQVKVYERDHKGNITSTVDTFSLEHFDDTKDIINKAFQ